MNNTNPLYYLEEKLTGTQKIMVGLRSKLFGKYDKIPNYKSIRKEFDDARSMNIRIGKEHNMSKSKIKKW